MAAGMSRQKRETHEFDAVRKDGTAIAEIKFSVDALRTVRTALIKLAYGMEERPKAHGYLVLVDSGITKSRLHDEWRRAAAVLKPRILEALTICISSPTSDLRGIPYDPPKAIQRWLHEVIERESQRTPRAAERIDFDFIVRKLLIHQWLMHREPQTTASLTNAAGCSYPTVARTLKMLGGLLKRDSDRSVGLKYFPEREFSHLLAKAERARSTTRFVDRSGQPRSVELHLRRLQKLNPPGVAVGGSVGARHYLPSLDLVGAPRLDLSVHCHDSPFDVSFVKRLDPALERVDDPLKPATVVVHAVRHAISLFAPRKSGLAWADPLECLFDLHECRLEAQARQFLNGLENGRVSKT